MNYPVKTVKAIYQDQFRQYPNFHKTGSIRGMKKLYYGKEATLIKCGSYIYHVPMDIYNKY